MRHLMHLFNCSLEQCSTDLIGGQLQAEPQQAQAVMFNSCHADLICSTDLTYSSSSQTRACSFPGRSPCSSSGCVKPDSSVLSSHLHTIHTEPDLNCPPSSRKLKPRRWAKSDSARFRSPENRKSGRRTWTLAKCGPHYGTPQMARGPATWFERSPHA